MNKEEILKKLQAKTYINSKGCWIYEVPNYKGYPKLTINKKRLLLHQVSFLLHFDHIPEIIHHTCENRRCWNPEHLQATTRSEHMSIHFTADLEEYGCGHPKTPENSTLARYYKGRTYYKCKLCHNANSRRYHAKRTP